MNSTRTQSRNTWVFIAACLGCALVICGLYLLSLSVSSPAWQSLYRDVATAVLIALLVSGVWRLWGNRLFAQEILELQNVGESVQRWGIKELSMDWEKVGWPDLFDHAKEIDIVHGYGYSWGGSSRQAALERFAAKKGRRLRVALPDPGSDWVVTSLAKRFSTTEETVRSRIQEAVAKYQALRNPDGADLRVYFRDGEPMYAAYRFDDELVVTLYTHRRARVSAVPAIVVRGGELLDFVASDFAEIFQIAAEVPLTGRDTGSEAPHPQEV